MVSTCRCRVISQYIQYTLGMHTLQVCRTQIHCTRTCMLLYYVLNFQDDPRLVDTHVLNPEWVTNGVYKILNET